MSQLPEATRAADQRVPPKDAGTYVGTATAATTSAANLDLNATYGGVANRLVRGGAYFSFQARGSDVYVRFKATSSTAATTGTDSSNGYRITNGSTYEVYLSPSESVVDFIATANCTMFWWQSSPNYDNR